MYVTQHTRLSARRHPNLSILALILAASIFIPVGAYAANYATIFSENFDSVTAPALPSGWSGAYVRTPNTTFTVECPATRNQSKPAWYTQAYASADTAPNVAYAEEPDCPSTNSLTSPPISIHSTAAQLTFRHTYTLEADTNLAYEGGVLEISIGGAPYQDILAAGGTFMSGGYNKSISTSFENPLKGRQAWTGNSGGLITSVVALPAAAKDQSIQLRWVLATDVGNAFIAIPVGWRIDSVSVSEPDTTPPVISNVPNNITRFVTTGTGGAVVTYASPTAVDDVDGTVPVTCAPASGSTFPLGDTTVTCTATDSSGNVATRTFMISVVYNFLGFYQPVDNLPVINRVKAGQGIPIKFSLSGYQGLNIIPTGSPGSKAFPCNDNSTFDPIEQTTTAGNSTVTYDAATDQYTYVWKTNKDWRGCRRFVLVLNDGSEHAADFNFTR